MDNVTPPRPRPTPATPTAATSTTASPAAAASAAPSPGASAPGFGRLRARQLRRLRPGFPGFGPGGHRGGRGRARTGDVRLAILSLLADASVERLRPDQGDRRAHRRRLEAEPRLGLPHAAAARRRRADHVAGDEAAKGEYSLTDAGRTYVPSTPTPSTPPGPPRPGEAVGRVPREHRQALRRRPAVPLRRDRRAARGGHRQARRDAARALRDPRRLTVRPVGSPTSAATRGDATTPGRRGAGTTCTAPPRRRPTPGGPVGTPLSHGASPPASATIGADERGGA